MMSVHVEDKKSSLRSKEFFASFGRKEDGAITIFACFMVFMMLMVCGIAVDLMQNEMMRTRVQNTLDRAILADRKSTRLNSSHQR